MKTFQAPFLALSLAALVAGASAACEKSSFKGGGKDTQPVKAGEKVDPKGTPGKGGNKAPPEIDGNKGPGDKTPGRENPSNPTASPVPSVVPTCSPATSRKAARIAFVVDNSGSHGRTDGALPQAHEYWYTDPVTQGPTPYEKSAFHTLRQKALHELVPELARLDSEARAGDPTYKGTDVGLVSFPASAWSNDSFTVHSGKGALPSTMTNLAAVPFDVARRRTLWDMLAFTHRPDGMTPYRVALQGAVDLLASGRVATDTREEHVILLTDGLPTDERPSRVLEARKALGAAKVHLIYVRKDGATQTLAESTSYEALKLRFLNEGWGSKPNDNDGYPITAAGFESYWADLTALPGRISDAQLTSDTAALKQALATILSGIQGCK